MPRSALPLALFALTAPAAAGIAAPAADRAPIPDGTLYAQLTIHERIIIRVPRMSQPRVADRAALAPPIEWKERKGPKCIAAFDVSGAILRENRTVDLLMSDGQRLRARLDGDCKPLDYYSGFYIRPAADGQICADRDAIRMRSGATCRIDGFKMLKPKK